jgi:CopG family nickel-responsive transcriptional regulator
MAGKITRFGVSIEPDLLTKFDTLIKKGGYTNRSEAIRDLIRKNIIVEKTKNPFQKAISTLTIIYDHHKSSLTKKLLNLQHNQHGKILSTTHIHIDHQNCLEVLVLKGKIGDIRQLADNIKSLKGIKYGELVITKSYI